MSSAAVKCGVLFGDHVEEGYDQRRNRRRITRSGTNLAKTRKGRRRAHRGPGKKVLMSTAARARPSGGPQQPELTSAKDQQKPARWA
jgi:hypothetical protein